jgi:hypothetical protein
MQGSLVRRPCRPSSWLVLSLLALLLPLAWGCDMPHSSPAASGTSFSSPARVRSRPKSVPQCGSVRHIVPDHSPLTILGR